MHQGVVGASQVTRTGTHVCVCRKTAAQQARHRNLELSYRASCTVPTAGPTEPGETQAPPPPESPPCSGTRACGLAAPRRLWVPPLLDGVLALRADSNAHSTRSSGVHQGLHDFGHKCATDDLPPPKKHQVDVEQPCSAMERPVSPPPGSTRDLPSKGKVRQRHQEMWSVKRAASGRPEIQSEGRNNCRSSKGAPAHRCRTCHGSAPSLLATQ